MGPFNTPLRCLFDFLKLAKKIPFSFHFLDLMKFVFCQTLARTFQYFNIFDLCQLSALCGLVISFVIQLNKRLASICHSQLTCADSSMVSVERVLAYTKLQPEAGYKRDILPAKDWPKHGAVTLKNLFLVYYPNGPQVLKDLSCSIMASEKVRKWCKFV